MLQALAVAYLNAPIDGGYRLTFECLPRELNVRADYLSLVSALRHCDYRLRAELFHALDAWWGPHSASRWMTIASRCRPPTRAVLFPLLFPGGGVDGCLQRVLRLRQRKKISSPPKHTGRPKL